MKQLAILIVSFIVFLILSLVMPTMAFGQEQEDSLKYVSAELKELALTSDIAKFVNPEKKAEAILDMSTKHPENSANAIYMEIMDALYGERVPFTYKDLLVYKKVRTTKIDGDLGMFGYQPFSCRFVMSPEGKDCVYFEKTAGSQRKSGNIYNNTETTKAYLGAYHIGKNPRRLYGSENSEAGLMFKRKNGKAYLLIFTSDTKFELLEFTK